MDGRLAIAGCVIVLLAGCHMAAGPDLDRLYRSARTGMEPVPVVLIHGLMGARLGEAGAAGEGSEVWPGPLWKLVGSGYGDLANAIDPESLEPVGSGLVPTGLTDRVAGRDFYRSIIEVLERAGGYRLTRVGAPPPQGARALYVFLYDWRQDNQKTAVALDAFIAAIRRDHADPDLEVDVIAHSMGGLVARYFIRYGPVDVLNGNDFPSTGYGAARIRRVVLLGAPNLGSIESVRSMIRGRKLALRSIPPEVLATMPSLYQLFPHAITDWVVTPSGDALDRDVFDVDVWRRMQWGVFDPAVRARIAHRAASATEAEAALSTLEAFAAKHLERARRFLWSLTVPVETPVPLVVFGGDCELTPARLVVENVGADSHVRFAPGEIARKVPGVDYDALFFEPGDGVVTKASLLARQTLDPTVARHRYSFFPLDYSFFLCAPHDRLTANVSFQDNLLHALLSVDAR